MCHNPAILFEIEKRGFVKEGYKADLVLINPNAEITVSKENISQMWLESTRKQDFPFRNLILL
jgi:dihydroorotase-like cyclic amidohydrolase